ncbi:hypothetical protein H6P81_012339 [Aristolochia fimbriata]|uniref:Pentatricopeptide repeat-containing protein n=1 Tax=Aristolochia fimbriata TaxID=158543 RepID=A0AAV7ECU1_ARIFI|nr:hypothetical protein H6P81_012339 [Aristolochia fimbriata]
MRKLGEPFPKTNARRRCCGEHTRSDRPRTPTSDKTVHNKRGSTGRRASGGDRREETARRRPPRGDRRGEIAGERSPGRDRREETAGRSPCRRPSPQQQQQKERRKKKIKELSRCLSPFFSESQAQTRCSLRFLIDELERGSLRPHALRKNCSHKPEKLLLTCKHRSNKTRNIFQVPGYSPYPLRSELILPRFVHRLSVKQEYYNKIDNNPILVDKTVLEDAERICRIVTNQPHSTLESSLNSSGITVSPALVKEVLRRLSNSGLLALAFFRWAEKQSSFKHNTEGFRALIEALGKIKQFKLVWNLVSSMTAKDFNKLVDTVSKSRHVRKAQEIFDDMKKSRFSSDLKSYTILLEGWGQEQNLLQFQEVYQEMRAEGFEPDVVTYGILINAYCKARKVDEAINIFNEMKVNNLKPSPHIYCTLINGLGSDRRLTEALRYFELSKASGFIPETPTYNAVVEAYCWVKQFKDAFRVMDEMMACGINPNSRTYDIVIHHLLKAGKAKEAWSFFLTMGKLGCDPGMNTYTMMVGMFCTERNIDMALKVWKHMYDKRVLPCLHMFSSLINGLCEVGRLDEAIGFFQEMMDKGIRPPTPLYGNLRKALLDAETHYIDDLENILDECMILSFNAEIEDGSVEEIAEKLMIMHEDCLQGNFESIENLRNSCPVNAVSQSRQVIDENNDDSSDEEDSAMAVDLPKPQLPLVEPKEIVVDEPKTNGPESVGDGWTVVPSRRNRGKK